MQRVLVLGANGMLGRTLVLDLLTSTDLAVAFTNRPGGFDRRLKSILGAVASFELDAENPERHSLLFSEFKPDWVINCIGIVKQRPEANDPLVSFRVNSVFPHWVSSICKGIGAHLIHISTDCVFDGSSGYYKESDHANSRDIYGRSKALGEVVSEENVLTLRTSIVGHEVQTNLGLLEWCLGQRGVINGYQEAFFSGLTTTELSEIIIKLIRFDQRYHGLYHLAGPRISKFDLLQCIKSVYQLDITIRAESTYRIDRSLLSEKWAALHGYQSPEWPDLLASLLRWKRKFQKYFENY